MSEQRGEDVDLLVEYGDVRAKISAGERDGDRWNPKSEPFHRSSDGAGVQNVLAHVLAVIDTAQHIVRPLFHQCLDRQHHTVGRSSIHLVLALTAFHWPQRVMQRERMAGWALLTVRGNDRELTERFGGTHQTFEPVGEDAIIVRTQESHQRCAPMPNRHRVLTIRAESRTARKWLGTAAGYL